MNNNNTITSKETLFNQHINLAYNAVKGYRTRTKNFEDLTQVALMELWKCIDRYNPDMGVKFSTYATNSIMCQVKQFVGDEGNLCNRNSNCVYLTVLYIKKNRDMDKGEILKELRQKKWFCLNEKEFGDVWVNSVEGVKRLDEPVMSEDDEMGREIEDKTQNVEMEIENQENVEELKKAVIEVMGRSTQNTKDMLNFWMDNIVYGRGYTLEDIGKRFGMSRQRVGEMIRRVGVRMKGKERDKK